MYPGDTNVSPVEEPPAYEPIKEKQTQEVLDYSDYAWKRLDEEEHQQFSPGSNEYDQEFSPAEASPPLQAANSIIYRYRDFHITLSHERTYLCKRIVNDVHHPEKRQ
ncbi:hypothetical protein OESDEN_22610 [Oesophagostomum dentatum]|uniref:Uncharacterized protein n=1 Tax=Oesophagostomum dentatum TaxID=61180 RepID=A0A0B1S3I5_OESDE|nr:hypothetical protein OESDEN_22610 [Oesophagostomum dentatum]